MTDVCITVDLEPDCPPFLEGWSGAEVGMPLLLDMLAGRGVATTVFTTGDTAQLFPALVARIPDEGHELACHGQTHRAFSSMSEAEAEWEIATSAGILRSYARVTSFRAPFLDFPSSWTRRGAAINRRTGSQPCPRPPCAGFPRR
jgi:peptidoglycan/xylan/chitin deacetylase (PgdA/CDA1 family)